MKLVLGLAAVLSAAVGALIGFQVLEAVSVEHDRYDGTMAVLAAGSGWFLVSAVFVVGLAVVVAVESRADSEYRRPWSPPVTPGSDLRIGRHDGWS